MQKQYKNIEQGLEDFQEEWEITKKEKMLSPLSHNPLDSVILEKRDIIQKKRDTLHKKWATLQENMLKKLPCDMNLWNSILDDWKEIQDGQKDLEEAVQCTTLVNAIKYFTSIGATIVLGGYLINYAILSDLNLIKFTCHAALGAVIGTLIGLKYPKMTSYAQNIEQSCRNTAVIMTTVFPTFYRPLLLASIYGYHYTKWRYSFLTNIWSSGIWRNPFKEFCSFLTNCSILSSKIWRAQLEILRSSLTNIWSNEI